MIRQLYDKHAIPVCQNWPKGQESAGDHYKDYFGMKKSYSDVHLTGYSPYSEGEEEGFLKLSIEPDEETAIKKLEYLFVQKE